MKIVLLIFFYLSNLSLQAQQSNLIEYDFIKEPIKVYSLQTEGGTYIADEIVTHNCIYQFKIFYFITFSANVLFTIFS